MIIDFSSSSSTQCQSGSLRYPGTRTTGIRVPVHILVVVLVQLTCRSMRQIVLAFGYPDTKITTAVRTATRNTLPNAGLV